MKGLFKVLFFLLIILPVTVFLITFFFIPFLVILVLLLPFLAGKVFTFRSRRWPENPGERENGQPQDDTVIDVEGVVVESTDCADCTDCTDDPGDGQDREQKSLPR